MRFAVDWDGTCRGSAWPGTGPWLPGAIDALHELDKLGHVLIHSCRVAPFEPDMVTPRDPTEEVAKIREALDAEGLTDVEVWTRNFKPPADFYIDDKGVHYNGRAGAWPAIVTRIKLRAGKLEENDLS